MGFFDVLVGRRKLEKPKADRLFALTTAYVTMETAHNITSRGAAAIVFQPIENSDFQTLIKDAEEVVRGVGEESDTRIDTEDDKYGYRWLIVRDEDFEDLVVALNALSTSIESGGYGERILASVFAFQDEQRNPIYWIYNYKRGLFHPFVPDPAKGGEARDNERELRLRAQIGTELPVEPELERWLALYGIPI